MLRGLIVLAILAAGCSSAPDPFEQARLPVDSVTSTTALVPRRAGEPQPTPALSPDDAESQQLDGARDVIHVLGSLAVVPDDVADWTADAPILGDDLATVVALGCPLDDDRCTATPLDILAASPVDVVSLATDAAEAGGIATLALAAESASAAGVRVVGFGATVEAAVAPIILAGTSGEIAVHAISLSSATPVAEATDTQAGIAGSAALPLLIEQIETSVREGRGVIVLVDWGPGESRAPDTARAEQAALFAELGVDAIVGAGSGFLQRFDRVDSTAVAYDLGHATTEADDPILRDTAIARLEFGVPGASCLLPATATPQGPLLGAESSC